MKTKNEALPGALDVPIVLAICLHVIVGHPEVHNLRGEPAARARQCRIRECLKDDIRGGLVRLHTCLHKAYAVAPISPADASELMGARRD